MESLLAFDSELRKRFESLGLLHKRGDKEFLSAPYAFGDDIEDARNYGATPARVMSGMPRLEELRLMARALKLPEEKLADSGDLGFSSRLATFVASDESVDRYGDVILVDGTLNGRTFKTRDGKKAKGWQEKNFLKNPVFMFGHEYTPELSGNAFAGIPLGLSLDTWHEEVRGRKMLKTTVLFSDGTSNPMAPRILAAYIIDRTMRAVSVGFLPESSYSPNDEAERKDIGLGEYGYLFTQQELLENSAVSVPGNPNALMDSLDMSNRKGLAELSAQLREFVPEFSRQVAEVAAPPRTHVDLGAGKTKKRSVDGVTGSISFEERIAAVHMALRTMLGDPWAPGGTGWCQPATFDDSVVVEIGSELTRYAVAWDGEDPEIGAALEVEAVYVPSMDDSTTPSPMTPMQMVVAKSLDSRQCTGVVSRLERLVGELNGAVGHVRQATKDPSAAESVAARTAPPDADVLEGLFTLALGGVLKPKV
jgi:hypothetical protein